MRRARKLYAAEIQAKIDDVFASTNETTEQILQFHQSCWPEVTSSEWEDYLQPREFVPEPFPGSRPAFTDSKAAAERAIPAMDNALTWHVLIVLLLALGSLFSGAIPIFSGDWQLQVQILGFGSAFALLAVALSASHTRRTALVSSCSQKLYEEALAAYSARKESHETRARAGEGPFREEDNKRIEFLRELLAGNPDVMETALQQVLEEREYPLETNVAFTIQDAETVVLDVDMPEVEHVPTEKASRLASGKISIKKKPESEIRRDYATVVHGIALWLASVVFQTLPTLRTAYISGYTQRLSKKDGNIHNDYILSLRVGRKEFYAVNAAASDPIECATNFDLRRKMTKTFVFSEIQPHCLTSDLSFS